MNINLVILSSVGTHFVFWISSLTITSRSERHRCRWAFSLEKGVRKEMVRRWDILKKWKQNIWPIVIQPKHPRPDAEQRNEMIHNSLLILEDIKLKWDFILIEFVINHILTIQFLMASVCLHDGPQRETGHMLNGSQLYPEYIQSDFGPHSRQRGLLAI